MASSRDREYFTTNIALLLKAAVPIGEALDSLAQTAPSAAMKRQLDKIKHGVDEGQQLSETLEASKLVSRQTLALARIGEESGSLATNLELAAEQEQKQRIFKSKLRSAMMYPAFVLGITLVVGLGIAWFLLPRLADTFSQLNAELPPISVAMINVGLFLRDNGFWAVPAFFGALLLLAMVFAAIPALQRVLRSSLLHLPGIGKLIRELEVARFGYMLGTLIDAGLPVTRSLELLTQASSTPAYQRLFQQLAKSIDAGMSFQQAFSAYRPTRRLIPASARQVVIAGENSGSLSKTLRLVGDTYDNKVDATTRNFEVIIEPVLLVGVWIGVMLVAIAVILPIYSLIGGLNA